MEMQVSYERVTEAEVGKAVLHILDEYVEASISTLKRELPKHLRLSDADRRASITRPGEQMWEQQVRNLVSHRATAGNVICEGLVHYRQHRLAITDRGRAKIAR